MKYKNGKIMRGKKKEQTLIKDGLPLGFKEENVTNLKKRNKLRVILQKIEVAKKIK